MDRFMWRCYTEVRGGIMPVSMLWYASATYRDCCDYMATRLHLANKNRKIFIKHVGSRERIFRC